jgi:hypothetical protein
MGDGYANDSIIALDVDECKGEAMELEASRTLHIGCPGCRMPYY